MIASWRPARPTTPKVVEAGVDGDGKGDGAGDGGNASLAAENAGIDALTGRAG
jgi:hypothetical protein